MLWMMAFFAMVTGGAWQDRVPVEDLGAEDRAEQVQVNQPLATVPPTTTTPPVAAPSGRHTLTMPSVGFDSRDIYRGGQETIDSGAVTAVTGWAGMSSCLPPSTCTVWLAAHRTTHGSTFGPVEHLSVGDIVTIRQDNERWDYRITHKDYCNTTACIYGDLALQTSWPGTRLFAYGERV